MTTSRGKVRRLTGAAVLAMRERFALSPGDTYEIAWAFVRAADPTDPTGDTVRCAIQWLDKDLASLGQLTDVALDLVPTVADGRQFVTAVIGETAAESGVDFAWPAGAVHAVPLLQTYGSDGVTDAELLEWRGPGTTHLSSVAYDALDARLAALETVTIDSFTVSGGTVYELGQSITATLNWTVSGAGTVTAQDVNGNSVAPGTLSWTGAAITADTTFTLTVTDASDRDVTDSVTVDFRNRVYWGASDALVTDSAGVLALEGGGASLATSRGRSFSVTTDGEQYVYYAYPAAWGSPSEVVAYGFPTSVSETTISLTTAAGHTEDYRLVRLDQTQNGTVPVEVS